jgi:hypothetical protein
MRRARSAKTALGSQTAQVAKIPAPIGGLNTRDPRSLVPVSECYSMSNFYVTSAGIAMRKGFTTHTNSTAPFPIKTLMVYINNAGAETMFAARLTDFYNISAGGALGAAVVTGLTSDLWQWTNFTNSAGTSYLCCFNGVDSPRYWNGTAWITITGASVPAITGLTTTTIISAAVHQRRMWLVQVDSLKAWYLPIDSVGGAAQALDLGGIATKGGYIMAIESWTIDGGAGIDDYLVCMTSQGQMIAFQGTDPSSASTWAHVGTWDIAEPVNRRCLYKYKGDVLIMTVSGIASARRVMSGDTTASGMLTDKISGTYASAYAETAAAGLLSTWQLLYYPKADILIWAGVLHNKLMNTVSGAWGDGGISARCWAIFNEEPYCVTPASSFGVVKYWSGTTDGGSSISASLYHGYSDFGAPGIKKANMARAIMTCEGASTTGISIAVDYGSSITQLNYSMAAVDGITDWLPSRTSGTAFSVALVSISSSTVTYGGAFLSLDSGGIIGPAYR